MTLLPRAHELLPPVLARLEAAQVQALGAAWLETWDRGLPPWHQTPGGINLPVLLWLHNLLEAWGMEGFCRARYGLLGHGDHWFPGANAGTLDQAVSEADLLEVLGASPWAQEIPPLLRRLNQQLGGHKMQRLVSP